ncbi:hypothetical protein Ancab_021046 [Ancistrocladus abbreviatus]
MRQNRELTRLIQDHQADFVRLINEPVEGGESDVLDQLVASMPQAIQVTHEEHDAIERAVSVTTVGLGHMDKVGQAVASQFSLPSSLISQTPHPFGIQSFINLQSSHTRRAPCYHRLLPPPFVASAIVVVAAADLNSQLLSSHHSLLPPPLSSFRAAKALVGSHCKYSSNNGHFYLREKMLLI